MPFVPDPPFPKSPGHPIMAKDWNDSVNEMLRLNAAKVNKAGDAVTGPLTIAAALGVGTVAPAAGTRLHVVDSATPAIARVQSTMSFGAARLELWSDPQGSANEWRPGYIESFDLGGFTGGLRFVTNGTGAANKQGNAEQLRLVNGLAGFGVTNPGFKIDTGGRIRVREGFGGTAGIWLYQNAPSADRAFVGMANDSSVGLWGNTGAQWGLQMDTTTGNLTHLATTTPATLRIQSRRAFGAARVELWSDPPGSTGEWRPGFVESFDAGNFTGGLRFVTNGTGAANKQGEAEQLRLVNGLAGFGVTNPGFKIDTGGRIRIREGYGGTAGIWFFQTTPNADRAFVGMANDNAVGFWGHTGIGWGLQMDTTTGNVTCAGRVWDQKYTAEAAAGGQIQTTSEAYVQVPNMSLTFNLPVARRILIVFHLPGVQLHAPSGGDPSHAAGNFRLMVDTAEVASTRQEWHNNGWELKSVYLTRLVYVAAGQHTVSAQWAKTAGGVITLTGCWYSEVRVLQVFEQ